MKNFIQLGYAFRLGLLCIGGTSFGQSASCPEKLDHALCEKLNQVDDTAWVGCMIELKTNPIDSQVTDPTKDTSTHPHTGYPPPAYLVSAKDSLFTTYDLHWPEKIGYRQANYPAQNRASVPDTTESSYGVFATKKDLLSIGTKDYVLVVWSWAPSYPVSRLYLPGKVFNNPQRLDIFNSNGQKFNRLGRPSNPILIRKY